MKVKVFRRPSGAATDAHMSLTSSQQRMTTISIVQSQNRGWPRLKGLSPVTFRKLLQSIYSWWGQTWAFTHLVSVAWAESCRYHGSHALVESQSGQPGNFGTEWGAGSHWLWGTASPQRRCGDEGSEHTNTSIQNSFTEFNWSAFGQLSHI